MYYRITDRFVQESLFAFWMTSVKYVQISRAWRDSHSRQVMDHIFDYNKKNKIN